MTRPSTGGQNFMFLPIGVAARHLRPHLGSKEFLMTGGIPVDLILFGMVAAFLVLRLRSVLGRRTGFERPVQPEARPNGFDSRATRTVEGVAEELPPVSTAPAGRALPD